MCHVLFISLDVTTSRAARSTNYAGTSDDERLTPRISAALRKSDERTARSTGYGPKRALSQWVDNGNGDGWRVGIRRKAGKPMGQTSTSRRGRKPDVISEERWCWRGNRGSRQLYLSPLSLPSNIYLYFDFPTSPVTNRSHYCNPTSLNRSYYRSLGD